MDNKHWLESLTIRGQIVTSLPAIYAIAKMFGLDLPDGVLEALVNGLASACFIVGGAMTVFGRFRANRPLSTGK